MTQLVAGQTEPIEAAWYVDGVLQGGAATVAFRDFSTGAERYWDGAAWVAGVTTFAMAAVASGFRYLLVVPAAWTGLAVQVTCAKVGLPDVADEIVVESSPPLDSAGVTTLLGRVTAGRAGNLDRLDAAVTTRASQASVDALGAPVQAADVRLDHLDADVSSRASAAAVAALGDPAQADDPRFAALDAPVTSRASAAAVAALGDPAQSDDPRLAFLDAAVTSRSSAAAVAALGAPLQAADVRVAHLDADVSSRATAAAVAALGDPVQTDDVRLDLLDVAVSTRASAASVAAVAADVATLLARITGARSVLLDNLARLDVDVSSRASAVALAAIAGDTAALLADVAGLGAPAQAVALAAVSALVDDLETRLTAARAALLDNLVDLDVPVSSVTTQYGGSLT